MNSYFSFSALEIIKKSSQKTILKATDNKGRFLAIKIDKTPSSVLHPFYFLPYPSSSSQTALPSSSNCSSPSSPYSILPHSSSLFSSIPLGDKQTKEIEFLIDLQGIRGVPIFFGGGVDPELKRFTIVQELTGPDLSYYFQKLKKFSLATTLKIALQLITTLRNIHEKGIIHRNLKPNHLGISRNGKEIIILNFGSAHRLLLRNKVNKKKENQRKFVGNLTFCGLNAHSFKNDTKVDDMVSLGIIIIYFLQGNLAWDYPHNTSPSRLLEEIAFEKVNFFSNQIPVLYPLLYPYFNHLWQAKKDDINYDYLTNVIKGWAKCEQINLFSETWDWQETNSDYSLDADSRNADQLESSMENYQDESVETPISELMRNYRVPNL